MKSTDIKEVTIHAPINGNGILEKCIEKVNCNKRLYTLWKVINVNAIDRLGMADHGPVHFQIVANIALRLSRLLTKSGVKMSVVANYGLKSDHAEVIIFLASILHDLGMSISREGHEEYSLFLANDIIYELVDFLPIDEATIVVSEVLHAIISHRHDGTPYTIEAGIVRVADALDMSKGRSRIPYEEGKVNIHSISAAAIDGVKIKQGIGKPIKIQIEMNNSAGIFQVDELLRSKLKGSKIEEYVEVTALLKEGHEKRLLKNYKLT